jgi:ribosomal protein S18 acetylase RimI-like enzyme
MLIRQAQSDDLPALVDLYRHLHASDAALPAGRARDVLWGQFLKHPGLQCFVGEVDGTLVASCCLAVVPNLTRGGRPFGVIENVVTHGDYRRRGLGTTLMRHALEAAWSARCYKVMLQSNVRRVEAHRFYERCGFSGDEKLGFVVHAPR